MAEKYLIVVDMQNDFVSGALGTVEAQAIVPHVVEKVQNWPGKVIFTQDTHANDYLSTQEGRLLPVEHCIEGTDGWRLISELEQIQEEKNGQFIKNRPLVPWNWRKNFIGLMRRALSKALH